MPFMTHDGLAFHYREQGEGTPFIFQHGLGGDVNQTFDIFRPPPGFRLITMDCRGHGETRPLGDPLKLGFCVFADDLLTLMAYLHVQQAVVGGISMGAAVALNFVSRFPTRVLGLVLSRPAWLDRPNPENLELFGTIAQLIRQYGSKGGLERFKQSQLYANMLRLSPDAAHSLVGHFEHPRAEETVAKLEQIPQDAPNHDWREWASIRVPTLILANRQDPVHPYTYGEQLAQVIPNAEFQEVTAKSVSKELHTRDVQTAVEAFLVRHFSNQL